MRVFGRAAAAVLLAASLGAASFGAGAAEAASANRYTSFWALGDSLSDPGNLFAATGGASPAAPYVGGRFSNGPVWAEHLAADFAAKGLATGNFAYGGAAVGPNPPPARNLAAQIGDFAAASQGRLGKRPVVSLWFGANDLFAAVPAGAAKPVGRLAAEGVAAGALALQAGGVRDVVLFNLPSLDKVPLYAFGDADLREDARKGTKVFNRTLAKRAEGLRRAGMQVTEIDMDALFRELLDDPASFGVANAEIPCVIPGVRVCDLATEAPLLAFFDPVHPNGTVHGAIADVVRAEVAPVPLPLPALMLLAGLGGLGFAARRRRA